MKKIEKNYVHIMKKTVLTTTPIKTNRKRDKQKKRRKDLNDKVQQLEIKISANERKMRSKSDKREIVNKREDQPPHKKTKDIESIIVPKNIQDNTEESHKCEINDTSLRQNLASAANVTPHIHNNPGWSQKPTQKLHKGWGVQRNPSQGAFSWDKLNVNTEPIRQQKTSNFRRDDNHKPSPPHENAYDKYHQQRNQYQHVERRSEHQHQQNERRGQQNPALFIDKRNDKQHDNDNRGH